MAIVTNYNYSQFNLEKAKSGSLCAIVSKSLSATSGSIMIEDTEDVCVSFSPSNNTADYKGKGICRVIGSGSLCITIGGVDYIFNNVGLGTGNNSIFYKLVILTIASSIPTRGESVTRGLSGSTPEDSINITGMSARDEFASQALKGLMARVDDPSTLSDSEINYYCSTAYRWASLMMLTAANVRDAVGQESSSTPAHIDMQYLDSNVERLLNNIAVAISNGGIGGGTISGDVSVKNATNTTFTTIFGNSGLGSSASNPLFISMPGYLKTSDIADWAKAATKPSYTFSELTSHPTTLSGYGITDAKIQNGTITLGSSSITPISSIGLATPTGLLVNGTSSATLTSNGTFTLAYDTNNGYIPFTNTYKLLIEKLASWFNEDANGDIYVQNRPNGGSPRGFYSNSFISALGASSASGGGGGTGVSLNEPLATINNLSPVPTTAGTSLMWNGSTYTWGNPTAATHYHDDRYYISDNTIHLGNSSITPLISEQYLGTVTSVAMTVPTGFSITGTPITSSGTLALSFASGYSLPTSAKQSNWDTAYSQSHTHSNKLVLDGITSTKVSNWDGAVSDANILKGYFDSNGVAKSAAKLTTVSKTAWGQTYWTSGGVPTDISGAIQNTGSITPSASGTYNIGTRSNYYNQINGQLLCLIDSITNEDFNIRWWPASREVTDKAYVALYAYETKMSDLCFGSTNPTYGLYFDSEHNKWGIGTNTPSQQLHVVGNIMATGAVSALGVSAAGGSVTGAVYLNDLQDVDTAGAADGKVLTYSNGGWIAQNPPTPSLSGYATQAWANGKFVTAVGVTGNQLYYTLNGANSTFTVPYALSAGTLDVQAMANRTAPDSLSGTKAFSCDNLLTANDGYDYVGLQVGYSADKWQLTALGGHLYIRQKDSSTWTDWNRIWDASSVGSGSGLDADLLDGTHKADLFTALTSNASTPLSVTIGGTTKSLSTLYATRLSGSSTYKAWGQTYWENGVPKGNVKDTLYMLATGATVNSNSAKLKFNSYDADGTDVRRSPYIQAINEADYGRKRLSVFQSNAASWGSDFVEAFTILPNGNVGIGTTAPSQKLHVVGNIMASGAVSALGMSAAGTTGGSLATLADVLITSQPSTGYVLTFNGSKWVPQATQQQSLDGYLPLTGGVIEGTSHQNLVISSTAVTNNVKWTGIQFGHKTGDTYTMYGGIRIDEQNGSLKHYNASYTAYNIWDSGNLNPMRMVTTRANDNYDALSLYNSERGSFVAVNFLTGDAYNSITLTDKSLYSTLVSFGYGNRTIQFMGYGWDNTLKYRHVYTKPGTGTGGVTAEYVLSPWQTFAFTSDLANYLPLTGGDLSGNIYVRKSTSAASIVGVANSNGAVELLTYYYRGVYDRTGDHWIIMSDGTNNYLPSGNVGIGYGGGTTLSYKLDVNGSAHFSGDGSGYGIVLDNDKAISLKDSSGEVRRALFLNTNNQLALGYGTTKGGVATDKYDTAIFGRFISFGTGGGNNTDPTIRMTIDKDGKVGIGAAPTQNELLNVAGKLRIGSGVIEWDATNQMLKFSGGNGIYAVGAVSALGITGDLNGQITRPLTFNDDVTMGTYTESTNTKSYKINFGSSGPYLQRNNSNIVANVTGGVFAITGNISATGTAAFTGEVSLFNGATITQGKALTLGTTTYQIFKDGSSFITIKGATKFTGAVTMDSSLTVSGSITANSTTTLNGNTTVSGTNKMIFGDSDNYIHRKATTIQDNTTYSLHLSGNEIDVDAGAGSIYFSGIAEFDNSVSVSGSIDIGDGEQIQFGTKGYLYTSGNNIYWHNNSTNTNTKIA